MTPDISTAPARLRHPRFDLSDGVRGLAAFAVIVIHVGVFTIPYEDTLRYHALVRLDVAFAVFFVLSAFLLYRPMIAHRAGGADPPGVRDYFIRRGLRVYPALWLALTVLAIFPGLLGVFDADWLGFYTLAVNLGNPYDAAGCAGGDPFRCGLPQTWSLTAEVTFYFVLPLYALLTGWIARRTSIRGWVALELGLLALLSALSALFSVWPDDLRYEYWYRFSFLGNMIWIALGLGLAVVSVAFPEIRSSRALTPLVQRPWIPFGAAALIWLTLVLTLPAEPYIVARETDLEFLVAYFSFAVVAGLVLIPVFFEGDGGGLGRRILRLPLVAWLGAIAFGIFLWHVTIAFNLGAGAIDASFWVTLVFTVLLTVPLAALSYYAIERPLMIRRSIFWRRRKEPPVASSGLGDVDQGVPLVDERVAVQADHDASDRGP